MSAVATKIEDKVKEAPLTVPLKIDKSESWKLFDTIAERYDLLNYICSAGILSLWRQKLVDYFPKGSDLKVLDCATGTGEVMFSIMDDHHFDIQEIHGLDLSKNMMKKGLEASEDKSYAKKVCFHHASATQIPFNDNHFDCVSMAFGIRNVDDYQNCLKELYRVVKPQGRVLIMEFSLPKNNVIKSIYLFYFRHILPFIAGVLSKNKSAYRYLNKTVEAFPYGDAFVNHMKDAGFSTVWKSLTFGIASLYIGTKNE